MSSGNHDRKHPYMEQDGDHEPPPKLLDTSTKAIQVYLASEEGGLIKGIGNWQVANGYTAIALHDFWSGSLTHVGDLRQLLAEVGSKQPHYINEFSDDSMWWAMANLELWALNNDNRYIAAAQRIWSHVKHYRISEANSIIIDGKDMEGAVLWTSRPSETQVNTITTGLFAELTARLALWETGEERQRMIDLAQKSLLWILRCRYDQDQRLVLDTIDLATHEYKDWTFTYTTGQTIAAAVALFEATRNEGMSERLPAASGFLEMACDLACDALHNGHRHTQTWFDEEGILTAPDEYPGQDNKPPWQNDDAVGFKSILVRSLAKLYRVLQKEDARDDLRSAIQESTIKQFHSLETYNTNGSGQYGPYWAGPFATPTSHSQLAVLDVMAAIYVAGTHKG